MDAKTRDIFERMAAHGHSPSAQAQNLADFAALALSETTPILDSPTGGVEGDNFAKVQEGEKKE